MHYAEHKLSVLALCHTPETKQLQKLIESEYRHILIRWQSPFSHHTHSLIDKILNVLKSIFEWQKCGKFFG